MIQLHSNTYPFGIHAEAASVEHSSGFQLHELELVRLDELGRVRVRHRVRTSEAVQLVLVGYWLLEFVEEQAWEACEVFRTVETLHAVYPI